MVEVKEIHPYADGTELGCWRWQRWGVDRSPMDLHSVWAMDGNAW